jgi:membrane protein DedA with SNARE-associated domain
VKRFMPAAIAVALLHIHLHIHHLHGPPFDYLGLALACFASWIGLPGPGEPVLAAAGLFAARDQLSLSVVLAVAFAAANIGGIAAWVLGIKAGRAIVTVRGPLRSTRLKVLARGEQVFARYPKTAVMMTPAWVAGIHHVRASVFLPINALSAVIWAGGIGLGGYFAGPTILDWWDDVGTVAGIGVAVLAAGLVGGEIIRRRRRRAGGASA